MTATRSRLSSWSVVLRSARIISGLFLLAFITMHLINMMLGIHSIQLVDEARPYLTGLWTGPIGSKVLMTVLLTHFALALEAIYNRETLRMSPNDTVQFLAGLLIIPMLIPHAIGIGAMNQIFSDASYEALLKYFWLNAPFAGLRQVLLVGIIWIHGCMGLFVWLRSKEWAHGLLLWLYPIAVAVPVFALLGYVEAGRDILMERHQAKLAQSAPVAENYGAQSGVPKPTNNKPDVEKAKPAAPKVDAGAIVAAADATTVRIISISTGLLMLTLLARYFRVRRNRKNMVEIDYLRGPVLKAQAGPSLLDIARLNHLPHANLCHGRGRCGTCRVRILSSTEPLPEPSELERKTLDRLKCEPGVRLACQLSPTKGELRIERILPPDHSYTKTSPKASLSTEVT